MRLGGKGETRRNLTERERSVRLKPKKEAGRAEQETRRRENVRRRNAVLLILAETERATRGPDDGRKGNAPSFETILSIMPPEFGRRETTRRRF